MSQVTTEEMIMQSCPQDSSARVAVFIDADNILIAAHERGLHSVIGELMYRARQYGEVYLARAYGSWTVWPCLAAVETFQSLSIAMALLPTSQKQKNTADMQICVDAMEAATLGPGRPDYVLLGTGDRDFVPLAQRLREYGIRVVVAGVNGSVSRDLCASSHAFEDLDTPRQAEAAAAPAQDPVDAPVEEAPPTPAPTGEPATVTRDSALDALLRAVRRQIEDQVTPLGSRTAALFREECGEAALESVGFSSWNEFVAWAERRGVIRVIRPEGRDLELALPGDVAVVAAQDYDFSTAAKACETYQYILSARKGVPLIPYGQRLHLVGHLVGVLRHHAESGLTLHNMNEMLKARAALDGITMDARAIEKITHTMNIAGLFRDADTGGSGYFTDLGSQRLRLHDGASTESAMAAMHQTYVNGIHWAEPMCPLRAEGIALLLFGGTADEHVEQATGLIRGAGVEPPPPSPFDALLSRN
jgi:uncharacterized LabA/DUF88 family protein